MRVIAGKAKGRRLRPVPGDTTRPILDKVKESLFSILYPTLLHSRWIDLFAGTGGVGIEALSRGASHCVFIDKSRAAVETIRHNLQATGLSDLATVCRSDALSYLNQVPTEEEKVDVVFVAPPQYIGLWLKAVGCIDRNRHWLLPEALVVVQIDPQEYHDRSFNSLELADQRKYGRTMLCFYRLVCP